jgi:photosystem II stability/assembly factor-like uncharacterized protein
VTVVGTTPHAWGIVWRSTDSGNTWTVAAENLARGLIAVWGAGSDYVAVGGAELLVGLIVRSATGGASWQPVTNPSVSLIGSVAGRGRTVLVPLHAGAYLRSDDGGATWQTVNLPVARDFTGITIMEDGTVVGAGSGGYIWRGTP